MPINRTLYKKIFSKAKKLLKRLGSLLGTIQTYILLTLIYVFIVGPAWIFLKVSGRDVLTLRAEEDEESYWIDCEDPLQKAVITEKQY